MEAMKDGYLQAKTTAQRKDLHDYKQKRRELRERYFKNRAKVSHIFCNIWQYAALSLVPSIPVSD